jgi:predicted ATPase
MQGQREEGLAQMHQGLAALLAAGSMLTQSYLVWLAEVAGHAGRVDEGLRLAAEALATFETSGAENSLAEAYRLKGEMLLQSGGLRPESGGYTPQTALGMPHAVEAEACFQQALAITRLQQAKSWELRAAMSLSRLWQQQGKRTEARELLAPIYG